MRVLIYILFPFIFVHCKTARHEDVKTISDTSKILEAAINYAMISPEYMPSISWIKKYSFGDSILLTSKVLPLAALPPRIDNKCFKILPDSSICELDRKYKGTMEAPNYLEVSQFENRGYVYYVQISSLSCFDYGGGGTLGLYFKKVKDSLVLVEKHASSIN